MIQMPRFSSVVRLPDTIDPSVYLVERNGAGVEPGLYHFRDDETGDHFTQFQAFKKEIDEEARGSSDPREEYGHFGAPKIKRWVLDQILAQGES